MIGEAVAHPAATPEPRLPDGLPLTRLFGTRGRQPVLNLGLLDAAVKTSLEGLP
jgi:hypothetical protein